MPRFHIPPHAWNPDRLALDSAEAHHATDVLRMKAGDRATVFNGEGAEAEVEITKAGRHGIELGSRALCTGLDTGSLAAAVIARHPAQHFAVQSVQMAMC